MMKYLLPILFLSFFCSFSGAQETPKAQSAITALKGGDFKAAIQGFTGDLEAMAAEVEGIEEDELRLHQARAHHLDGQSAKAVDLCDDLLKGFPESKWRHKAVFLKAEALAAQRKFSEALFIYQSEASRIFSEDRQDEVAESLVTFAELFATVPAPGDLDAPPADYAKALILFRQVLDTECTLAVRERVRSRVVTLNGKLPAWDQVVREALVYLDEFDPAWKGDFGSVRRLTDDGNKKVIFSGPNRFMVRYRHGEALHRMGQRSEAVRYLEELDELIQGDPQLAALRADAHWLRLMAMTEQGNVAQVDLWVAEARAYLTLYPNHIWAPQVAYKIATTYQKAELWEKARAAFQDFLDAKGFQAPLEKPLTLDEVSAKQFESRKRSYQDLREAASYEIGGIFLAEKKFNEASAQWSKTAKDFPNGEKWAECQKGLVQADFERALESVRQANQAPKAGQGASRTQARQALEGFLTEHPLDTRLPQLMFALGEISYFEAIAAEDEDKWILTHDRKKAFETGIASWRRLISKYPKSAQAKAAQIKIGGIYEVYLGDLEKALEIYSGLPDGQSRKAALLQEELSASSSKVFGTEEEPKVSLSLRNIEKVQVRQYWIDFESYFRKSQNLSDVENLDVDLVEPDKTWEVVIPDYQRYLPMTHGIAIPFPKNKAGVCVIKVEGEKLETTTVVVRSDIDLAIRHSRGESLVFVRDWKTGKAAPGVRVVLADGAKVIANGTTGNDGVWHLEDESLGEVSQLRVLAISDRGMAGHSLQAAGLMVPQRVSAQASLTTSRVLYRPGETVDLKVAVRDVKDGLFVIPDAKERDFVLKVRDDEQRLLRELKVVVDDFGLAQVAFDLPPALMGSGVQLTLEGKLGGEVMTFGSMVPVGHLGLRRVTVALELEKSFVAPGELIKGTIKARYRWGAPLANRKVLLDLPGGLQRELITNELGDAVFDYPTKGSALTSLSFWASAPSTDAAKTNATVRVVDRDYTISAGLKGTVVMAGRDFQIDLEARSLDGKPRSQRLKVVLERPVEEHPDPVLVAVPGLNIDSACVIVNEKVQEVFATTDEKTGKGAASFQLTEGGPYSYRVFDGDLQVSSGRFSVSGKDDVTKLRLLAAPEELFEGMVARPELHSRLDQEVPALLTFENDHLIEYRIIQVKPGSNEIVVPLTVAHTSGFQMSVMALHDRQLHQAGLLLEVRRKLEVEMVLEGIKDGLAGPGEKARIKVRVKDAAGKAVSAGTEVTIVRKEEFNTLASVLQAKFHRPYVTGIFGWGSSCGFHHEGAQRSVNLAMQEELNRQVFSGSALNQQSHLLPNLNAPETLPSAQSVRYQLSFDEATQSGQMRGNQFFSAQANGGIGGGLTNVIQDGGRLETSFGLRSKMVETNAQGEAVIEMMLPKEADEWMVSVEALTKGGAYGKANEALKVREELTLSFDLPSGVAEGDFFHPAVTISRLKSEEKAKGTLKLTVKMAGKEEVTLERVVNFKKGQQTLTIEFPKFEGVAGGLVLEGEVSLANLVNRQKKTVSVSPWGAPMVVTGGVLAKAGETSFKVNLPVGAKLDPVELRLQAGIRDFLSSLRGAGHGGLGVPALGEHPASALLAEIAFLNYSKKRGQDVNQAALQEAVGDLVAAVTVRQGEDGGWSRQVGRSQSDLKHTVFAFEGLMAARSFGVAVDGNVLTKAKAYLTGAITQSSSDDRAMIHDVLSLGGEGDFSACNRLFRSRAELSAFGRAHLAAAFVQLKRPEFARQLLENLGEIESGSVETPARALQAWAEIEANSPQSVLLENELWKQVGGHGFPDDLTRGVGALGLSALYAARDALAEDFTCVVSVNGKQVSEIRSGTPESRGFLPVPVRFLKEGENEVSISLKGRGLLRVGTTITGVLPEFPKEDWNGDLKVVTREFLHPGLTYRGLPLRERGRSPITKVAVGERVNVHLRVRHTRREGGEVIIWEKIPAGFEYLADSLSGGHSGARIENGYLVITHVGKTNEEKSFYYQMVAKTAGDWRVLPTTFFPLSQPERATYGTEGKLIILATGKKVPEKYQYQVGERYELASLAFGNGEYAAASEQLAIVRKDGPGYQADQVARMTLWIETSKEQPDAQLVADSFEVLSELSPELEIPFSKILQVGEAYRKLKEFERGMGVFQATLEAGFATESFVGAALEDQGRYLDALDYQARQWMDFPDQGEIANSWFTLGQQVYIKATEARNLTPRKGEKKAPTARELYLKAVAMLERFRVAHPGHPLADDGAFSIANALFTLQSYEEMVSHARACRKAYPESNFSEAFQYLEALGNFWLRNYDAAFAAAKVVADGTGKDRDLAAYICAQILHAQGKAVDALKWYEKVKGEYPDARDSIAWFEQKKIALDEVTTVRSGQKVDLELRHRNISKADLQIYRVDLMKLYLREKNLSNISQVNLAGISPKHELGVDLKNAQFSDQETKVQLPIAEDGAYLVICRGDYLYTSGLILVTPIKMETQEDANAGSVRVNMTDRGTGDYLDAVHVKAIGSQNSEFITGETDLRGVWKAEGLKGTATVIARDQKGRYAFYRGESALGMSPQQQLPPQIEGAEQSLDYNGNNYIQQKEIWTDNEAKFDKLRRSNGKGVKVNKALKK